MTGINSKNNQRIHACASCSQSKVRCDRIETGLPFSSRCLRRGTACENLVRTKKCGRPPLTDSQKQEAAIERKRRAQFPDLYPPSRLKNRAHQKQQKRPDQQSFSSLVQQQLFVDPQQLLLEAHAPQIQEQQSFLNTELLPQPFGIDHLLQLEQQQQWFQPPIQKAFQQCIKGQRIQQPLQQPQYYRSIQEAFEAEWEQWFCENPIMPRF